MDISVLELTFVALAVLVAFVLLGTFWGVIRQKRREYRDRQRMREAKEQGLNLPTSLYPVIDPDLCSGCLSCLDVCPEGDLFGVRNGKAVMIESSKCIGHGICVDACPTGAITLVFGSKERGIDLPETDDSFETARPGVYVVGELGGMGLIKNALKQGLEVARNLKETLERQGDVEKDVAIIGAGPAGVAAAVGCRAMGLSFRIFDQATVGGTIATYPRQKLVMMEPVKLPLYGPFGQNIVEKEELMEAFDEVLDLADVTVHEGVKALDIKGDDGCFKVVTDRGSFEARKVVVATGRRGSPRKLEVPGEDLEKVTYNLVDPAQYTDKRVLVVGGGDSALEAAIMLAEEGGIKASISYRREAFTRCRKKNRDKIETLLREGKLRSFMKSTVEEILPDSVILDFEGERKRLANDYVIICAGGTLPTEFLKKIGITVRKYKGEPLPTKGSSAGAEEQAGLPKSLVWTMYALGLVSIIALTVYGMSYYPLERVDRLDSDLHDNLRPSGPWGHGIGIVATLMMMTNFMYSGRKRLNWFGFLSLRSWMSLHTFFGIYAPLLVAYHAAFQSNNLVATGTTVALFIVVGTGLVGRFLYNLLPTSSGRLAKLSDLKQEQARLTTTLYDLAMDTADPSKTQVFATQVASIIPAKGSLWQLFMSLPFNFFRHRAEAKKFHDLFGDQERREKFRDAYFEQIRLRNQIIFYGSLRRLMTGWRVLHISLACMLVVLIGVHIGVSLYLGFGWILF